MGPILILTSINDLPEQLVSQVRLFADDTAVYLWMARIVAECSKMTLTPCLCGSPGGTWSLIPQSARW